MGVGSSVVLVVHSLGDLGCVVVVKGESVVEEVNQNGAPLVLGVVGLTVLVVVESGAWVTLAVDGDSGLSGLTTGGVVGDDGGAAVLESAGGGGGATLGG